MHFVRVTWRRAFFLAYPSDRRRVERPEIGGAGWLAGSPRLHGVRASLLERRVVEEGVRPRIEDLVRKERRFRRVARDELQLPTMDALEHGAEAVEIHGLLQAIVDRLLDERMIRNLAIAWNVFQTGRGIGKDRRHQVVRQHPLQLRRDLAPAAAPRHGQRNRRVPTPPRLEHRRVEECLHQHVSRALGVQIAEHVRERERMLWSERQQQRVLGSRRLQLEVELTAESLSQRQAPGLVDSAPERRMEDELHPAGFIEEPFEHERFLRGDDAQRLTTFAEIVDDLLRRIVLQPGFFRQPSGRRI